MEKLYFDVPPAVMHNNVPLEHQSKRVRLQLIPFEYGDPAFWNQKGGNIGKSIAQLRRYFKGDSGEVVYKPTNQVFPISLKPWENVDDPNFIFLHFAFYAETVENKNE